MKRLILASVCAAALGAGCGLDAREDGAAVSPAETQRGGGASTNAAATAAAKPVAPEPVTPPSTNAVTVNAVVTNTVATGVGTTNPPTLSAGTTPAPAAPAVVPPKAAAAVPAPVQEVVRLAQTSVSDDVIVAYIDSVPEPIRLNADQIIYLRDVGISMPVIQALLRHDNPAGKSAAVQAGQTVIVNPAPAGTAVAEPAPVAPAAPASAGAPGPAPVAAGQGNVLLTNYLAATAGGPPTGLPAVANAPVAGAAPVADAAPVYGPGPTPVQPVAAPAPAPPTVVQVNSNSFYDSLSPYGNWVYVDNYGWCWQPTVAVVNAGWRPYCDDGRWLWTDAGWYWHSNYSWGWAAFHYGRWHHHSNRGWIWYPGTVWGPAWVTWRYSDTYCGWAPLPPEAVWDSRLGLCFNGSRVSVSFSWGLDPWHYSCVSFGNFGHREVWRHCVPRDRNVTIINNTTIVNNYQQNNTTIINGGLDKDLVARRSRSEVKKVSIQDASQPGADRVVQDGDRAVAVSAFRPKLPAQSATPPQAILARQEARKADLERPVGTGGTIAGRPAVSAASGIAAGGRSEPAARTPSTRPAMQPTGPGLRNELTGGNRNPGLFYPEAGSPGGSARPTPAARPVETRPDSRATQPLTSPGYNRPSSVSPTAPTVATPRGEVTKAVPTRPAAQPSPATGGSSGNNLFRPEVTRQTPSSSGVLNQSVATGPSAAYRSDVVRQPSNLPSDPATRTYVSPTPRPYSQPSAPAAAPIRSYSEPVRPSASPSPSYSAPVQRSAPSPSYSAPAPRSAPAPSYSAPAPAPRSAPSPSYSAPIRSDSGGSSRPSPGSRPAER